MSARRLALTTSMVVCVLAGAVALTSAQALGAAPEAPGPVMVEHVGATRATVNGVSNPGAEGQPGIYEFLYKESKLGPGCESGSKAPESPGLVFGFQGQGVSQELTGLSPETEYTVCLVDRNLNQDKGEETVSPAVTFKTNPVLEAPKTGSPATDITASSAKLQGVLNPGGPGDPGTYEFVYRQSASECQRENPETHQLETEYATPTEVALGGEEEAVPTVPAEVSGLSPNTTYTFCLLARNEAGETAVGSPVTFTTESRKPSVSGESFSHVESTSATIGAQVETGGLKTTFTVKYGTTSAYGLEMAVTLPAGSRTATAQLSALQPNTEYHFRVAVANGDGSEVGAIDTTFTTLPATTVGLPDGRVYEMVTPAENRNADVQVPEAKNTVEFGDGIPTNDPFQVAPDGSAITYPVEAISEAGNGKEGSQYLAAQSPQGGWTQSMIQPAGYLATRYQGFSSDLSVGIIQSGDEGESEILPPLSPEAPGEGYKILYQRDNSDGTYRPLITNTVKLNQGPGSFGSNGLVRHGYSSTAAPVFAGGSADFDDVLFEANDALLSGGGSLERELETDVKTEIAEGSNSNYLYDETQNGLSLVDVSPEGKVVPNATFGALPFVEGEGSQTRSFLGWNPPDFSHVISADGSRVYWTDLGSGVVYAREDNSSTVQVSAHAARYWTASTDGRYAFYTEGEGEQSQLYRFDAESEGGLGRREALTDTGVGVLGVIGASEDGETVYFVARGVLAQSNDDGVAPLEGQPNLYVLRHGEPAVFIATLSEQDGSNVPPYHEDAGEPRWGDWQPGFGQRTARVTGDGSGVVFMSDQSLHAVGYPKGTPNNGTYEVYVYQAGADQLFCASCSPTGEAPPTSDNGAAAFLPVNWSDTYLPQWLSEDGNRVIFDSAVPLVPQDTNGTQDVYEWEREGYGSCVHGDGATGGCVFLLSGGTSEADSWFVGASANGDDVFMVTRAQLVPEDGDDAFNLYDARVDGVRPVSPPACTGTGCQGVPAPPPTFATPPSVTFDGVGNFLPPVSQAVKPRSKKLTRAQKLANALRVCKRERRSKRRESCEARAKKRYGTVKKIVKDAGTGHGRKHV